MKLVQKLGRPVSALKPEQIQKGMSFVSYIPGDAASVLRGQFTSELYWADDEAALVCDVIMDKGEVRTIELCALGIGTNRHGETPLRACIEADPD